MKCRLGWYEYRTVLDNTSFKWSSARAASASEDSTFCAHIQKKYKITLSPIPTPNRLNTNASTSM